MPIWWWCPSAGGAGACGFLAYTLLSAKGDRSLFYRQLQAQLLFYVAGLVACCLSGSAPDPVALVLLLATASSIWQDKLEVSISLGWN